MDWVFYSKLISVYTCDTPAAENPVIYPEAISIIDHKEVYSHPVFQNAAREFIFILQLD